MLSQKFLSELRKFVEKEQRQAVDESARKKIPRQCARAM